MDQEDAMSASDTQVRIAEDIEENYAQIGRAVVANAVEQLQDRHRRHGSKGDKQQVVSVPVWITMSGDEAREGALPIRDVCCICWPEGGAIHCQGTCCNLR
jgi:hypothetical protein